MKRELNKFFTFLISLVLIFMLISCEDVINVKLKDASPHLVVEGIITDISDSLKVLLHMSTDYFNPGGIQAVTDAAVKISDSHGNIFQLNDNKNGLYSFKGIKPMPGETYNLNITTGGVTYSASTVMPDAVRLDTIMVDSDPVRKKENRLNIYFRDPEKVANYYQLKIYRNGELLNINNHLALFSDKYSDGKFTVITIDARRFDLPRFEVNDSLRVQLINLDKMMYDYYQILRDITDQENFLSASTPANPPNNLSNEALGYFSAFSISQKSLIVK